MNSQHEPKHLIVLSAPSGAGKTTVAHHLLNVFPELRFSVSATTRTQRAGEVDGKDYHFLTKEDFAAEIDRENLVEYEQIYGNYYGTLRSEVVKAMDNGHRVLFDVDVKGALSLRRSFPDDAILIFIAPPSVDELEKRLLSRHTETAEQVALRMERVGMEMAERSHFDIVIVNDDLEKALAEAEGVIRKFAIL